MSISVKGRLAIVALIALACLASSVLKLYLGLLCISLLVSFAIVGVIAWLVDGIASKRHRGPERRRGRRRRCSALVQDPRPLPVTSVDHIDTPSAAGQA
ncbi:hypothetical protein [Bradyrhizobium sp. SRS-191]|uniref:hypothetical protein n=1 Tax=Bradyrhizobium sp. SRS-191 TaxID=2962606 RepID=UPI00211EBC4C|nr:hypothetical protein [Bradyrhizobium sp. SRS-191]